MRLFLLITTILNYFLIVKGTIIELLPYGDPEQCNKSEYFNVELLKCELCDSNKFLIPAFDRHECRCDEKSIPIVDASKMTPHCEKCKQNHIFSTKLNACIRCTNGIIKKDNTTHCKPCKDNEIMVHHFTNGTFLSQTRCVQCTNGMIPSKDGTNCIPCPIKNPININGTIKCTCSYKNVQLGNLCIPSNSFPEITKIKNKYFLQYQTGEKIDSLLFETNLKLNIYLCKLKNATACQILANMCALTLFSNYENSPCNFWLETRYSGKPQSVNNLPGLVYREGEANVVLYRKKISAQYSLNPSLSTSRLNLTGIIFNLNGTFKEVKQLLGGDLNLCPGLNYIKDEGLRFGVNYYFECNIDSKQFFHGRKTEFIVPYLQYLEHGKSMLYAVPVLIRNLAQFKNQDGDTSNWLLVRRFFMFDTISSINSKTNEATILRYVKSIQLKVKLRETEDNGLIYPPLLILEYDEINQDQFRSGDKIKFQFSVNYEMKSNMKHSIEISIGVLSAFAVLYSGIQTWSHHKRSGKLAIDLLTLARICQFACGNLANAFFIVAFGVSVHTFIFYKGQNVVHLLLPTKNEENIVRNYLIVAFSLKIVEIVKLLWFQISIDIFLIDWERPKPQDTIPRPRKTTSPFTLTSRDSQQSVSIWRSYFIANEWNEIQTKRKINLLTHILVVTFLLKVVGLEYWGTPDPELHTKMPGHLRTNNFSFICRFAVGSLVYVIVYLIQLIFVIGFYERYIQNSIQQFVDVCSLANISVFIMSLERYGYYIHGRSSHGFSDTDMATMIKQLKREEDDLCSYRGLLPGTHHQTFSVGVPAKLRLYYNKLMTPTKANNVNVAIVETSPPKAHEHSKLDNFSKVIQAYHNVNKFLSAFLEHALKDLDYDVKDKLFVESLLDIEFTDCLNRGVLYTDSGHSFDNILFYGNEFTLFSFDLMLFSFVLILSDDFIITFLVTLCVEKILKLIRNFGGKRNLAQKTLIDERFLI